MDYAALRWRRKLSSGSEFRRSLSKQLCPALTTESRDKHLKTPHKRGNRPNGKHKPGKVSTFSLFYSELKKRRFISSRNFIHRYYKFPTMPCRAPEFSTARSATQHRAL